MGDLQLRANYIGKLNRYKGIVNEHVAGNKVLGYHQAVEVLEQAANTYNDFETVQCRLVKTCVDSDALKVQFTEGIKGEDIYMEIRSTLRPIIESLDPHASASAASSAGPTPTNIRLPPIELPKFDGDITEWTSFKDLFTAAVSGNTHLGGAQKLQYLKSSLQGEAAELIRSFATTDTNYCTAWKLLTDRYDNEREIVFALIKKLINAKSIREESASDLQNLVDIFEETTRALTVLKRPVDTWDDLLVVLISNKMDGATRREWAIKLIGTKVPTYDEVITFLKAHIRGLKSVGESGGNKRHEGKASRPVKVHTASSGSSSCPVCSGSHPAFRCDDLQKRSVSERREIVKRVKLCFLCLGKHLIKDCQWKGSCRRCKKRHHTLLHDDNSKAPSAAPAASTSGTMGNGGGEAQQGGNTVVASHHISMDPTEVMMTAIVNIRDRFGKPQPVRVLVDNASGPDLISEATVSSLGLRRNHCSVAVSGVGGVDAGRARGMVEATVESRFDISKQITARFYIMKNVTGTLPAVAVQRKGWSHLEGLELADPAWDKPGKVDIILGARHFHKVLLLERRQCKDDNAPVAWASIFGWLVAGPCLEKGGKALRCYHVSVDPTLEILRKFWEIEEVPEVRELSSEEAACEKHFMDTHTRDGNGRFVVAVPFNEKKSLLGGTRAAAVQRFHQVERRMQRDAAYKEAYVAFMEEYKALGHMVEIGEDEAKEEIGKTAHLPHHGVINSSSTSTKFRCVFDGSQLSTSGISLNEAMMVGATVQDDLYNLLLKFRLHRVVVKADISKMFRQFLLRRDHQKYHRVVWRPHPGDPLKDYRLTTVTYGTACATFLATRCLHQLALEVAEEYPVASKVLLNSTYVDDALPSVPTPEEGVKVYHQLVKATATAQLELRKWTSNDPEVLAVIPKEIQDGEPLSFNEDDTVKALGVQWHPQGDVFKFKGYDFKYEEALTKRKLLSNAARVFDPLGLISCFSVRANMLLQELWKVKCDWDDKAPSDIVERWNEYRDDLKLLKGVEIPRQILTSDSYEIHGFSDSSERALGAIVYLKCYHSDGKIMVNFVTSKSKVAPVKLVTLPRLELEAALMLGKLVKRVIECLNLTGKVFLWTDSTITLKWIQGEPHRWKTFVGNRVARIRRMTEVESWRHVPGADNPADLASRGVAATELLENTFWWKGPAWLSEPHIPQFADDEVSGDLEERHVKVQVHAANLSAEFIERFSSLKRLKRVTAYMLRFIRRKQWEFRARRGETSHPWCSSKGEGPLMASELQRALEVWICKVQVQHFADEIKALERGTKLRDSNKLSSLSPFVDNLGILRVGGRLANADVDKAQQHQIIIPKGCYLDKLLVAEAHEATLHGTHRDTWAYLQRRYWVLGGKDKARHWVRKCVVCRRYRGEVAKQQMGNLPAPRVTATRAFLHTGVDYAGPFTLKNPVGRAPKTYKAYMCLFVCMATKAIHLEAVSSLSTEAFLEALRRFVARRGLCAHLYSDCGTNFVGAENELVKLVGSQELDGAVAQELSSRGVQWHFNPPSAPHHGGLWEAGVKSAKHHLRRVIGNALLTYEQFATVLCQVEAVLNSRPLYAISSDPGDLEALTPGHFLVGEALTAIPMADVKDVPTNRLNAFQQQQQRVQHFWRRWSAEYLNTLQQRTKWKWESENVKVGDLVLVIEESSPGNWKMGRIEKLVPGQDGLVRVVEVKLVSGVVKRPIQKLVPLVNFDNSE